MFSAAAFDAVEHEPVALSCSLRALGAVRRGGRFVGLNTGIPEAVARFGPWLGLVAVGANLAAFTARAWLTKNVAFRPIARKSDGEVLAKLGSLVDEGALKPLAEAVLPLADAPEAHRRIERGRTRGKLVLSMSA